MEDVKKIFWTFSGIKDTDRGEKSVPELGRGMSTDEHYLFVLSSSHNFNPFSAGVKGELVEEKHSAGSTNRLLSISKTFLCNLKDSSVPFEQWSEVKFGLSTVLAVL
jgi:hypothetical protein